MGLLERGLGLALLAKDHAPMIALGIVWRDDAQVVEQYAAKLFGEPARCELHVAPTEAA